MVDGGGHLLCFNARVLADQNGRVGTGQMNSGEVAGHGDVAKHFNLASGEAVFENSILVFYGDCRIRCQRPRLVIRIDVPRRIEISLLDRHVISFIGEIFDKAFRELGGTTPELRQLFGFVHSLTQGRRGCETITQFLFVLSIFLSVNRMRTSIFDRRGRKHLRDHQSLWREVRARYIRAGPYSRNLVTRASGICCPQRARATSKPGGGGLSLPFLSVHRFDGSSHTTLDFTAAERC
jgi:hypothetical protein